MAIFKLVHISDHHVMAKGDQGNALTFLQQTLTGDFLKAIIDLAQNPLGQHSHDSHISKQVAKFIGSISADIDALVISGDLAGDGDETNLSAALQVVDGAPRSIEWYYITESGRATLRSCDLNIILLPGNHDRFDGPSYSAGGKEFDKIFGHHWSNPNCFVRATVLHQMAGQTQESLCVIAADFCLKCNEDSVGGPTHYLGQGRAYSDVLDRLAALTDQVRNDRPQAGIVWAVHFPPCFTECSADTQCIDGNSIVDLAVEKDIHLILCGHKHESRLYEVRGVQIACAGTAMAYASSRGNWVHVLSIDVSNAQARLQERVDYRWSKPDDAFLLSGHAVI